MRSSKAPLGVRISMWLGSILCGWVKMNELQLIRAEGLSVVQRLKK